MLSCQLDLFTATHSPLCEYGWLFHVSDGLVSFPLVIIFFH